MMYALLYVAAPKRPNGPFLVLINEYVLYVFAYDAGR